MSAQTPGQGPTIACPTCGTRIEITKVLSEEVQGQVREQLQRQWDAEQSTKEQEFEARLRSAREKAAADAREASLLELADLKTALATKDKQVAALRVTELQLRQRARELDDQKQQLELEVLRRVEAGRADAEAAATRRITEQHRLADLQKDKIIGDLKQQLEDAARRAEQGSQKLRGEVLELDLEARLQEAFPLDRVEAVPSGTRGADVRQVVQDSLGRDAGAILLESKNAKTYTDRWLAKLRENQREAGANVAVLVTSALPEDDQTFGLRDGVWVCSPIAVVPLVAALRQGILTTARARAAGEQREGRQAALFQYIAGQPFRQRIEAIVEPLKAMHDELERQHRALVASASKQRKALEAAATATAQLNGEVNGVVGGVLQRVEQLALPSTENAA